MGQEAAGQGVPGAGAQDMLRRRMQGGAPLGGGQNIPAPAAQPQDNPAPPSPPRMMAAPQGGGMTVQNPYQQQPPPPQGSTLNTEKWAAGTPQGEGQTLRAVDTATQPRRQQMTAPKVEPGAQIGPEMGRPTPNNPSPNGPSRQGGGPQIKPAIGAAQGGGFQAPSWAPMDSGSAGRPNTPQKMKPPPEMRGAQSIQNPYSGQQPGMGGQAQGARQAGDQGQAVTSDGSWVDNRPGAQRSMDMGMPRRNPNDGQTPLGSPFGGGNNGVSV